MAAGKAGPRKQRKPRPLTAKQKLFVAAYQGNASAAAREAGYKSLGAATVLMKTPAVVKAIREREKNPIKPIMQPEAGYSEQRMLGSEKEKLKQIVADRTARQAFWTSVMMNPKESMKNRLKASELLGRSEGDFLVRIGGPDGGPVEVRSTVTFVGARDGKPV